MGDAAAMPGSTDDELASKLASFRTAVQIQGVSTKGLDDSTCMRFLRARSMNVNKAAAMYVHYHTWRTEFVPLGYIPFDQVVSELEGGKVSLQGCTRKGNPMMIILGCKHFANKQDHDTFKRFVVHILDKSLASAPPGVEKMTVIVDLKHLSYKNVDFKGFISGFQLLQNYYPERLRILYLVNVPKLFLYIWKMVSHALDKVTKEKIVFLEDHNTTEVLLSEMDATTLPSMFGGKAEFIRIQDVDVPNWPPGSVAALT